MNAPKEQQQKIAAYNELLEDIYLRKTELETLEGHLAAMKLEIEGDISHFARKTAEKSISVQAQERKSGSTTVTAFVRSPSPVQAESKVTPKSSTNPNAAANGVAAAIMILKNVAGATRNAKSRGKGKGRQEKAKLNGTDLKYQKGREIKLDDDGEYDYEEEESEEYEGEEEEAYEEDGKVSSPSVLSK